jgi:hypothetical protein
MFNHIWSIICQSSSIDKENNSINLFGCIENINVKRKDTNNNILPINFNIVSCWIINNPNKKNDLIFKITIVDPSGQVIFEKDQEIITEVGWQRIRNIAKFSGLKINNSGRYLFKISQKENDFKVVATLPVDINID